MVELMNKPEFYLKLILCFLQFLTHRLTFKNEKNILNPLKVASSGSWNIHIFVYGCTENYHTEKDCVYTYIHIPIQYSPTKATMNNKPSFLFQLNGN